LAGGSPSIVREIEEQVQILDGGWSWRMVLYGIKSSHAIKVNENTSKG
jgi:hypothetical protein